MPPLLVVVGSLLLGFRIGAAAHRGINLGVHGRHVLRADPKCRVGHQHHVRVVGVVGIGMVGSGAGLDLGEQVTVKRVVRGVGECDGKYDGWYDGWYEGWCEGWYEGWCEGW